MSKEYGYYGEKLTTITDEECTKIMEDIIDGVDPESRYLTEEEKIALKRKLIYEDSLDSIMTTDDIAISSKKFSTTEFLTEQDKNLFIEYAPKLFNTTLNPTRIRNDMYELVNLVYVYRLHGNPSYGINVIRNNSFNRYAKKSKSEKEKALIMNIEKVLDLMGGDFFHTEKGFDIKQALKTVCKKPSDYIPSKPSKPTADKNEIKSYLLELNLKNKTKDIEAFIAAIK